MILLNLKKSVTRIYHAVLVDSLNMIDSFYGILQADIWTFSPCTESFMHVHSYVGKIFLNLTFARKLRIFSPSSPSSTVRLIFQV